mmetsp:Transcript_121839/g.191239  ORF Transcript_121839/g.191239 Transcript_121839/m.191239 type:complete len:104 (-) Transcript_121839:73-384(-)
MNSHVSKGELMFLHCLFSMVFAGATIGVLSGLGVAIHSPSNCPNHEDAFGIYSSCEMMKDARSLISFAFGAVACCFLQHNFKNRSVDQDAVDVEMIQVSACLL